MEEIKYILWDIDGTLIDFDYAEKEGLNNTFQKFNLGELTTEQLEIYKGINDKYWKMLERGEISKKEVLEGRFVEFFNLYGIDTSIIPEFNKEYQISMGDIAQYNLHGKETVIKLKDNYKQYAVTNGTIVAQEKKLAKSGLDKLLDGIFISEEIGIDKPSKEYFQEVFKRVGSTNQDEYIIIGDSMTSDILGGKQMGIKTCWYNPHMKENKYDYSADYEIHDLAEVEEILMMKNNKLKI